MYFSINFTIHVTEQDRVGPREVTRFVPKSLEFDSRLSQYVKDKT